MPTEYCFSLWEKYVSFALVHRHLIPEGRYFELRYEALLKSPKSQLRRALEFIEYPFNAEHLQRACQMIDRTRLDNSVYAVPHSEKITELVDSPVMRQLGYTYHVEAR